MVCVVLSVSERGGRRLLLRHVPVFVLSVLCVCVWVGVGVGVGVCMCVCVCVCVCVCAPACLCVYVCDIKCHQINPPYPTCCSCRRVGA